MPEQYEQAFELQLTGSELRDILHEYVQRKIGYNLSDLKRVQMNLEAFQKEGIVQFTFSNRSTLH